MSNSNNNPTHNDHEEDDDETIQCICNENDPKDQREFIGCEICQNWQRNVCMGMPTEEDDIPDHYFCQKCRPEEHKETLESLGQGKEIWLERNLKKEDERLAEFRKKHKELYEQGKISWTLMDLPEEGSEVQGGEADKEEQK